MSLKRKWPRRKLDSKRRWIARFRIGKFIPYVVLQSYDFGERLQPVKYLINRDGFVRSEV